MGVLPLGTGNDLSRVLGWGAKFDDESQLSVVMEQLEHAQIKMLDRCVRHDHRYSMYLVFVYKQCLPDETREGRTPTATTVLWLSGFYLGLWVSQDQKGKIWKVKPIWIYWSKK